MEQVTMRRGYMLEGLKKEEMTDDEYNLREAIIFRIISNILHIGFNDDPSIWTENQTSKLLIFQEDVMKICQAGAGFTLAEADDIRRAMGKKNAELMESYREKFILGWKIHTGCFAAEIWDKLVDYAKYCFNKSHAVAYTLVTIKTAELCDSNNIEYMMYNYFNNDKKKANAINQLLEVGKLTFPALKNPFNGILVQVPNDCIEVKSLAEDNEGMEFPEVPEEGSYLFHELFLADLPGTIKLSLIQRGVYDSVCLDIHGLTMLNKDLGVNATRGYKIPEDYFENDSIRGLMGGLQKAGFIDFIEEPGMIRYTKLGKIEKSFNPNNCQIIMIDRNIGNWPTVKTEYRVKSNKKQFGIIKTNCLSAYDDSDLIDLTKALVNINKVLQKVLDNNPGKKISSKDFKTIMNRVPKVYNHYVSKKEAIASKPFAACVVDKTVLKNGSCVVKLIFSNDYTERTYYVNNKDIDTINGIVKGAIQNFVLEPNDYIGRNDSMLKSYTNLKLWRE